MNVNPNDKFSYLETESKLIADQIKAEKFNDLDNFIEAEKKKYKKSNESGTVKVLPYCPNITIK